MYNITNNFKEKIISGDYIQANKLIEKYGAGDIFKGINITKIQVYISHVEKYSTLLQQGNGHKRGGLSKRTSSRLGAAEKLLNSLIDYVQLRIGGSDENNKNHNSNSKGSDANEIGEKKADKIGVLENGLLNSEVNDSINNEEISDRIERLNSPVTFE